MNGIDRSVSEAQTLEQSCPPRSMSTMAAQICARDEFESILDIGRSKDARAGRTQHVVKVERNQRLIFHDEHGTPAQRIDASQNSVPSGANEAERRSRVM